MGSVHNSNGKLGIVESDGGVHTVTATENVKSSRGHLSAIDFCTKMFLMGNNTQRCSNDEVCKCVL